MKWPGTNHNKVIKDMREPSDPPANFTVWGDLPDLVSENCGGGDGSSSSVSAQDDAQVAVGKAPRKVCPLRLDPRRAQTLADAKCLGDRCVLHNGRICMLRTVCTALSDIAGALRSKY